MKRLMLTVVLAVAAVMVQIDCTMAETKDSGVKALSMQQVLLNPKGFDMDWSCNGKSGHSRVHFLREGEKIVAEIRVVDIENVDVNNPVNFGAESCTTIQELRDNGIVFYGCTSASWNILLAYDPGNVNTPFKGSGPDCPNIALNPH